MNTLTTTAAISAKALSSGVCQPGAAREAERRALVEHQHQVEEIGDSALLAGREAREHHPFDDLVGDDDRRREREPAPGVSKSARFTGPSGCAGSVRTGRRH
jgi:hypothetical protein